MHKLGVVTIAAMMLTLAGCAQPSTGPPPVMSTVVCGVTLDRAIGQAHVYDITAKSFNRHSVITGPTDVFVRVAGSCKQGSQVTIMPGDAFRVLKTVWAPDHLPVALVLEARRAVPTELVAYQHGRVVGILRTDVAKDDVSHTLNAANEAHPQLTPTAVTGAVGAFWMLGSYPCATGTCSALMRSADGGKSFVRVGTPPAGIYGIEFANLLDGYAYSVGSPNDRLYWTGDGGKTWRLAFARFLYLPPQAVEVTDGRAYVLVPENCSQGLCKALQLASSPVTSDTWTTRQLPLTAVEAEDRFGWAAFGSNLWFVWTLRNPYLLVSHDGGRTFSKLTPGGYLQALGCTLTATSPITLWGFCPTGNVGYAVRQPTGAGTS